ncbi:MAG: heme-binding protein [Magnetovibrio sp.]|nr:heme-binding protein [Magnetovibrio sp.]|tara:strand:+ start:91 stop:681 length:591 start_codon:yes stop_codon:yes gene_type:complete
MYKFKDQFILTLSALSLSACTIFGDISVKVAPFEVLMADGPFELRHYERLILVSTKMPRGMNSASGPFRRLFDYISGNNEKKEKIAMTAPVLMDQSGQTSEGMSFVLPENLSLMSAPSPKNPSVKLTELKNYTVAVVSFSGFLNQKTISTHKALLEKWIVDRGMKIKGMAKAAGYNPPFTLPFLRRNEVFIPVKRP